MNNYILIKMIINKMLRINTTIFTLLLWFVFLYSNIFMINWNK